MLSGPHTKNKTIIEGVVINKKEFQIQRALGTLKVSVSVDGGDKIPRTRTYIVNGIYKYIQDDDEIRRVMLNGIDALDWIEDQLND